jgi:phage baseplate assembly protein W
MRDRALRFVGAGLADSTGGLAVTAAGSVSMVDGDESIRQAIILLLCTTPGERLMRPDYGSHLRRLTFAPNDQTTAGLAIHYVRQAILRWEPRVEIVDVDAEADPVRPTQLNIRLRYRVRASLAIGTVDYPLSLSSRPTGTSPAAGR